MRNDDPQFNVRGVQTLRQPLKVIVDSHLGISPEAKLLKSGNALIVTTTEDAGRSDALRKQWADILNLPAGGGRVDLSSLIAGLGRRGVNELHVEGGFRLNGALLAAGLVDELLLYFAPCLVGDAARGMFDLPALESLEGQRRLTIRDMRMVGADVRVIAVSYTHLDVYKRQDHPRGSRRHALRRRLQAPVHRRQ